MVGRESKSMWCGIPLLVALTLPSGLATADDERPADPSADRVFADPAPLNQAASVWRTLEQIEELADGGRVIEAVGAWQMRLDGIAGTGPFAGRSSLRSLRVEPDWLKRTHLQQGTYARYSALRHEIENAILKRSAEDRETYDRETRPIASTLWKRYRATGDPVVLESLVERFFCGSLGPTAAIQLATIHLERGDPGQATELLERISRIPDLDPARRRATASRLRLARSRALGSEPGRNPVVMGERPRPADWTSFRGAPTGHRSNGPVDPSHLDEHLTDRWSLAVDARPIDVAPVGLAVGLPRESQSPGHPHWRRTVRAWRTHGRPPVRPAVESDGLLIYPGKDRLVGVNVETGRVNWMGRRHVRAVDPSVRQFASRRTRFGIVKKTPPDNETLTFFDRVPGSIAVGGGRVFALEGRAIEASGSVQTKTTSTNSTRRVRVNRLVCYDLRTGKQLWSRAAGKPDERFDDVGFLGEPLPLGDRLLTPVSEGGEVWLQAMSAADGRTLWRTLLCDEPPGGCSGWSPVRVVAAGSRIYVLPGTGAVFCLGARSGTLEWAVRYDRSSLLSLSAKERAAARYPLLDFVGWEEDGLVTVGPYLVLLPSDVDRLICLDRHEGTLLWDAAMQPVGATPAAELLGTLGQRLYVAGPEVVRCYEIPTGRVVWETEVVNVTGRGVVTVNAVYVPTDERLVALDVRNGRTILDSTYITPSRTPLGNLVVTRAGLVSVGATHVSALNPLRTELEQLAGRVEKDDVTAMLDRARLFHRLDRRDEAFADVRRSAYAASRKQSLPLARRVLEVAGDFDLPVTHARETLELAVADDVLGRFELDDDPAFRDRWNELVYDCVATIGREGLAGSSRFLLGLFDHSRDAQLLEAATTVLATTASPADLGLLRTTISDSDSTAKRRAAVRALESAGIEGVEGDLVDLLDDDDPGTRVAAATALVNKRDRRGLRPLVDLLETGDVAQQRTALALLHDAVDERFGFDTTKDDDSRLAAVARWRTWLDESVEQPLKLDRPVGRARLLRGRTLVANAQTGFVVEYDRTGRERWRARIGSARDVYGTEDGRRIAVSYTQRSLSVFPPGDLEAGDPATTATPAFEKSDLEGRPYSVRELPNGHLLVSLWDKGAVHEYDAEGQVVWKAGLQGSVADARRLESGNTLVTWYSQNAVVELDRDGKIVEGTRLNDMQGPRSAERLANGNTLVAQYRKARVVEVDPAGRVVWSHEGVSGVQHAQRLPNGNTLIVHRTAVIEVRRDGTVAWELPEAGVARVHRY